MAKGAESAGSDKAEMKKWLNRADAKPIHMAFAFGKDGSAVLKLDGMKQGRALEKSLKDGLPDSKNHRFGTVQVDPDNPDVVKFFVNKAVSGAARKLSAALKGTGFKKVQLVMDDGSVEDAGDDDEDAEDGAADGGQPTAPSASAPLDGDAGADDNSWEEPARPDPPSAPDDAAPAQADASDPGQSPPSLGGDDAGDGASFSEPTYSDPAPDAATLTTQLTGLVKQMMGAIKKDPTQKAALAELATDAQASLKRGDLDSAAAGLEILRQAIADAMGQDPSADAAGGAATTPADPSADTSPADASAGDTPAGDASAGDASAGDASAGATQPAGPTPQDGTDGADGGAAAAAPAPPAADTAALTKKLHKSKIVWTATRAKVDADLTKLSQAIKTASEGEDMDGDIEGQFMSAVEPVLATLDETLADELDQAASASDDATRQQLLAQARKTIASYSAYVQGNPIIDNLDSNPFMPLQIGKILTATLSTLTTIMR